MGLDTGMVTPPTLGLNAATRSSLLERAHRTDQRLIILLAGVHAMRSGHIRRLQLDAVDPLTAP